MPTKFGYSDFFHYLCKANQKQTIMAKDTIRGLFFDIDKYDRSQLSTKSEQELYDIAKNDMDCAMYTLDEISEMVNDDMLPDYGNWLFFVDLDNVNQ